MIDSYLYMTISLKCIIVGIIIVIVVTCLQFKQSSIQIMMLIDSVLLVLGLWIYNH